MSGFVFIEIYYALSLIDKPVIASECSYCKSNLIKKRKSGDITKLNTET